MLMNVNKDGEKEQGTALHLPRHVRESPILEAAYIDRRRLFTLPFNAIYHGKHVRMSGSCTSSEPLMFEQSDLRPLQHATRDDTAAKADPDHALQRHAMTRVAGFTR
jgi:hypothetical protein